MRYELSLKIILFSFVIFGSYLILITCTHLCEIITFLLFTLIWMYYAYFYAFKYIIYYHATRAFCCYFIFWVFISLFALFLFAWVPSVLFVLVLVIVISNDDSHTRWWLYAGWCHELGYLCDWRIGWPWVGLLTGVFVGLILDTLMVQLWMSWMLRLWVQP